MNNFNWDTSFLVDFNLQTGYSETAKASKRMLSQMKNMFNDTKAVNEILKNEDPVIYEWYELGCPERRGDLAFGTTVLYPGKIGNEYYMTKGHFHNVLETAEVYYVLNGKGYILMENTKGDTIEMPLKKGQVVYVPRSYAHRVVNTNDKPLVIFCVFEADAGHDYGTIEKKGFHKMVVENNGEPEIIDNQNWK